MYFSSRRGSPYRCGRTLALLLCLFAIAGVAHDVRAEGSLQVGLNQGLAEYGYTNVSITNGDRPIYVDIEDAGEVIKVSLCGDVNSDDIRVEIYNPLGSLVFTEDRTTRTVDCNDAMTGTLSNPFEYTTPAPGTYEVRPFNLDGDILERFDVFVADETAPTEAPDPSAAQGRIWSYEWGFDAGGFLPVHATDGNYFILVPGGRPGSNYVWLLDLNQLAGYGYTIIANNLGVNAPNSGYSVPKLGNSVASKYPLYLSYPPNAAPPPATPPTLSGVVFVDSDGEDNSISPGSTPGIQDTGVFEFTTDVQGTYAIIVDTDQDGFFGGGDRLLLGETVIGLNQIPWDGEDVLGNLLSDGSYPARVSVRMGEYHFVGEDIETSGGPSNPGLTIFQALAGGGTADTQVYWDDETILGGTTTLPDGYPSSSASARHNWGNFTSGGFGNNTFIDTYTFGLVNQNETPAIIASVDEPRLGLSKNAASIVGTGPFTVTFDFYLENLGDADLDQVQITDDLDAAFGAGNYSISAAPSIVSDPGGGLAVNPAFDGGSDQNLLDAASSTLGVATSAQVRVEVTVVSASSYVNTAVAGGDPPTGPGDRLTDDSVNGTDPDPDGNGEATDNTSDTPVVVGEDPRLGLAKDASVSGSTATIDFYLLNVGNTILQELQITDDLDATFGVGGFTVLGPPTIVSDPGGGLVLNAGFDGSSDQTLLDAASSSLTHVLPNNVAQIRVLVSVEAPGNYLNTAVAEGETLSGPTSLVTDDSMNGTDPDPDGNNKPWDDAADTPIDVAEAPLLGVSKNATVAGTGPFDVTLDFYLENFGNVALDQLQIADDLDAAFGAGNYSISAAPSIVSDPGSGLTVNASYDGSADQNLLDAASSTLSNLAPNNVAQVRVEVTVTAPGSYTNTAAAGGDPPSGAANRVTDDSVDGVDPDANGNDDPSDDDSDTPIDLAEEAVIGISKDATVAGAGPFTVTLDFHLENFGNVALDQLQIADDLDAAFGAGNYSISAAASIVSDPGSGLTVNASYDGSADQNLLDAASSTLSNLAPNNVAQLRVEVTVTAPGSYTNTAVAGGDPPSGAANRVTDDSVDGVDPDANGNDDPSDDDSDTPIDLAETPLIGVAKAASVNGTGPFTVTLDFHLENFGNVALDQLQITDDLDAAFGAGNYTISAAPSIVSDPGSGLTVNASYDGSADQNLLDAASSTLSNLAPNNVAQVRVEVTVTAPGNYTNTAVAGGDPPSGAVNRVTDDSVDGVDPDANGNDDPSDDDSDTPIDLAEEAVIGISKDATVAGAGPFTVTLDFHLENFGNVALDQIQIADDLDAAFGAGNYSISAAPSIVSDPGGTLTANAGYDGSADQNLLDAASSTLSNLAPNNVAQVRVEVTVTAPGSYTNTAVAGGDPPSGAVNRVTDDSVDGVDPDANGNDDPSDDDSDTPIDLAETPLIGVAKAATVAGGGPFTVTMDFNLENFGNVALDRLQIADDLDAAFGAGNYSISAAPSIVSDPGGGLTANAGYDGSADQNLLDAASSTLSNLAPNNVAQVRVEVTVTAPGSYTNTAVAGGDPPSGAANRVTDDSVDGVDPDANGNDDPSDDDSDTPVDLSETPLIGVAKAAGVSGTGPFTVTLDFHLENFGNVALDQLQIADDLDAAFGAGNYSISAAASIVSDPGSGLTVNASYDGSADQNLLDAASSTLSNLAPNNVAQVRVEVTVTAPGSYTNTAVAGGDPPSGAANRVTDDSVDGVDPDANGNDDPSDDDSDTPVDLSETPLIGVAKAAGVSGTGPFTVTLDFHLENFGNVALDQLQIADDLDAAFGAGNYSISAAPSIVNDPGGTLTANAGYDGGADQNLLDAASSTLSNLAPNNVAQVRVEVTVTAPGSYTNTAVAGGDPPSGAANRVTDDSVDGVDPDANGNDDPSDDDSDTPIDLAETPLIGVAKAAGVSGTGPFTVTLDFHLENFGNVALDQLQITDDLDAAFGAGNYSISAAPSIVSDPGSGLTVNASYDGSADQNLLDAASSTLSNLAPNNVVQVRVEVTVTAPGNYTNTAVAGGDPPSGSANRVTDDSVDGVDPDANGNDDPSDDDSDTPIDLAETPLIGVAKAAGVSGTGPFTVTLDFYLENFGNVALDQIQIADDLDAAFGAGNYSISAAPSIVSDPGGTLTANAGYDGSADQNLLDAASSTLSNLAPSNVAQVRVEVTVTAPGSYTNTAVAGGDPPSGAVNRVTDDSVDGVDPDANGNDDPSDDDSDTPIDLAETPLIGVAKAATVAGGGPFTVTMDFNLENFGNVALGRLQIADDLDAAFGAGNYSISAAPSIVSDPGGGLTANAGYDGSADQNLLDAASSTLSNLAPNHVAQVRVEVTVTAPGSYTNTAVAGGDPPSGPANRVTDDSVAGVDPDPDDDDDPSDDDGDTPVDLVELPLIGVAKAATWTGSGPFSVTIDFYVKNFGNVDLSEVQITDDLDATFGVGNYSITAVPSIVSDPGGGLTPNPGYDGSADQDLLNQASSSLAHLAPNDLAQIRIVVDVTAPGDYTNVAMVGADPPSGPTNRSVDASVNGPDPDTDASGDPTNDSSPTPINLVAQQSILLDKQVDHVETFVGDLLTYTLLAQNMSGLALTDVTLSDLIPAGFQYVEASAQLLRAGPDGDPGTADDVATPIDPAGIRPIDFEGIDFAPAEALAVRYVLRVGTGVTQGEYKNVAVPMHLGAEAGNRASETVVVDLDPLLDQTTIIGKVFHDRDRDGWQDSARATRLTVELGSRGGTLPPTAVEVDRGDGFEPVASRKSGHSFNLGVLEGRSSEAQPRDARRIVVRANVAGSEVGEILVSTGEGTRLRIDRDGRVNEEHKGLKRASRLTGYSPGKQRTAQQIEVDRRLVTENGHPVLYLTLTNSGIDEEGIPGVRVATPQGLFIETDAHGRYHLADVSGGRWERGRNFIIKVDPGTLPRGASFTTENPRVVRITRGLMSKINFGVGLPAQEIPETVVDKKIGEIFFDYDSSTVRPEYDALAESVGTTLDGADSGSLTIEGHTENRDFYMPPEFKEYTVTPRFGVLDVTLREEDKAELDRIIDEWQDARDIRIEATGHTSSVRVAPRSRHVFADNYVLSRARAAAVANYLQRGLQLPDESVQAIGRGPDEPVATNLTEDGRAQNRRTELRIAGSFPVEVIPTGEGSSAAYDLELSERRARAVTEAIQRASRTPICDSDDCESANGQVAPAAIVAHGDTRPRSDNASEEGRQDNRRVDVSGRFRVRLPGGGTVWVTEDPALAEPVLNVAAPIEAVVSGGRLSEPVEFSIYSNYTDYISRWELSVFRADDFDLSRPIGVLRGERLPRTPVAWSGPADSAGRLSAGEELVYTLRVYDAADRFDETAPRELALVGRLSNERDSVDPAAEIYGVDNLALQTIPIEGSRVRIHGTDVEPGLQLYLDGGPVPLDENGRFVVEQIKPVGTHGLELAIDGAEGANWVRELPVEVTGKYFFMVGMADLTVGQNDLTGNVEPLDGDDHYNGDVFVDGRIALYLKGKIKGKYLLTAQLDTREDELGNLGDNLRSEDPRRAFRALDPDRYYPVYGDDSTTTQDAASQGRFYVRMEWDKSEVAWGNFVTGFTGNEFAQYNRTLYGASGEYRTKSTTEFGDEKGYFRGFVSEPQTASAQNRFRATGGSLYYLEHTDIVMGSDKVRVEIIEKSTSRILDNVTLERGRDYEIDPLQGRIILSRPLTQVADQLAPSIVRDRPLDGDNVVLLVDYEYVPRGFDADEITAGARGKAWATDHVGLGATYVDESRGGQDYDLGGVDLTLRYDQGTYLKVEYAESESTIGLASISDDGGLTFSSAVSPPAGQQRTGDAMSVQARANLAELTGGSTQGAAAVWWREHSAGFSSSQIDDGIETTEYGAELIWNTTRALSLAARATRAERKGIVDDTSVAVQANYRVNDRLQLGAEGRFVEEEPAAGAVASGSVAAVRADYDVSVSTSIYGSAQATISSDATYEDNNMALVGARSRIGKDAAVSAEFTAGDRGSGVKIGGDYNLNERNQFYGTYTMSTDRTDDSHGQVTIGHRSKLSNQLKVFTENQFTQRNRQAGLTHVFGVEYAPTEMWQLGFSVQSSNLDQPLARAIERDVVSVSVNRFAKEVNWFTKLEYRKDGGTAESTQWLTTNRVDYKAARGLSVLGKLSLSVTEDDTSGINEAKFVESGLGLAYRPTSNDRWNLLGRYTFLFDLPSPGQATLRPDQRSHIFSLDAIHDISRRWEIGGKAAYRLSELRANRDDGVWFSADAGLVVLRGRYHLIRNWDGLVEYRWLFSNEAENAKSGVLLGLDRHIMDNLKLGIGYNFTDFTDDLTDTGYDGGGWFINVLGKY